MKNHFLSKSPEERLGVMTQLLKEFRDRATRLKAPFIILVYGSASYGFKKSRYGNLNDIDLFLAVPRRLAVNETLSLARKVFQTHLDIDPEHLQELVSGNWEMCRMYGESKGVRLGFRLLCLDTFASLYPSDGSSATIRNVAKVGQSRIVVDVEWSTKEWKYVPVELEHTLIKRGSDVLLLVNHHVFSGSFEQLGALGRKLLTCSVVYDSTHTSRLAIRQIWKAYVQICVRYQPVVSTGCIINSVMRSEKFSPSFRRRLCRLIKRVRE